MPTSLVTEFSQHELYNIGAYLHGNILQTALHFSQQLGKFDGYLKYVVEGTTEQFKPNLFMNVVPNLNSNVTDLRRRLDVLRDQGNMALTLVSMWVGPNRLALLFSS